METYFKKPTMETYRIIRGNKHDINKDVLLSHIKENNMVELYKEMCDRGIFKRDDALIEEMDDKNTKSIEEINKTSGESSTDSEAFEKDVACAQLWASALNNQNFRTFLPDLYQKNFSSSFRMDVVLCKIRMHMIFNCKRRIFRAIEDGKDILSSGCDWDRRNKFKSYLGVCLSQNHMFDEAADVLYESLPTFESKELMEYEELVLIFLFSALLSFDRDEIKFKVLDNSNVNETRSINEVALILAESFYNCDYNNILVHLYNFVNEKIKENDFLSHLANDFTKMFMVRIFKQLMESYKSLSLEAMAALFGVGVEFVESYLSEFIVDRKIECMIDKVSGIVFVCEKSVGDEILLAEKGDLLMTQIKRNIK